MDMAAEAGFVFCTFNCFWTTAFKTIRRFKHRLNRLLLQLVYNRVGRFKSARFKSLI